MTAPAHHTTTRDRPMLGAAVPADDRPAPAPGQRSDSARTTGRQCEVIELFPGDHLLPEHGQTAAPAVPRAESPGTGQVSADLVRGRDRPLRTLHLLRRRAAIRIQLLRLWFTARATGQRGMATAEYAIATLGAVAFAGLLVVIMRSDEVRGFLLGIIRSALAMP